ncbi:hypothetical protein OL053_001203 [Salmonella enterica]|nr:hypothetical protein [Salmonella enterica subsp. enterica serovar Litchfield]EDE3206735.1 hypothetical protein [Salmonella enterica subsp. enterica serovar Litchfield]EDN6793973.1 hypothetical protein [Salmonella enterica]EDY4123873.1 hypothetical protein [Salmonella enterica]EKA6116828.1 hypothetical protein [Salmonella enterica]
MKIPTGDFGNVTYTPSTGAPTVPNSAAVGNAMQNLANAGVHVGQELSNFGLQMMRNQADQTIDDIKAYGEQLQNNPKDGQFTNTGINAQGSTEKYSLKLSKYAEQRLSKLDPLTRRMAMKYVNSYMTSFQRSGNIFERNQNQIVQRENYRATMKNTIDGMADVGMDNAGAKLKLITGSLQLREQGKAMGLPDDAIQSDVHDLLRKGTLNQLSNIAAQDPTLLLSALGEPSDNGGTTTSGSIASKGVRGVRNNNPGNLVASNQGWDGELTSDGKFSRFDTPEHGIRALAKNMRTYQNKHDLNTVSEMISRFAPPEDHNDTPTYIKAVAGMMGVDPSQRIDTSNIGTLTKLVNGIITVENGSNPYTNQQISDGVLAAMGAKQLPQVTKAEHRPADAGATASGGVWGLQFLDPTDIAKLRNSANAQLERQQSKLRADLVEKLQDAKAAALNGQVYQEEIPVQTFISAYGADKGLKIYQQYQNLNKLGNVIGQLWDKSPQDIQTLLEQSKPHTEEAAGDGYANKLANYNALAQAAGHILEQRTKDPINFLIANGHMDALGPADLQSPDALKQALIRRQDLAQEYSRKFGTPLRVFSNAEAKGIGDMLSKMDPKAEVDYLGKMYEATSDHPDSYNAALGQLFPYSPTAQFSGVLMQYDKLIAKEHWITSDDKVNAKDVASLALAGAAARRTSKVTANGVTNEVKGMPMPPDEGEQGMRTAFNNIIGTAYAGHPDVMAQVYDISKDVYAGLMAQKGNYTGTLDTDAWAKAVNLATGGISNFNNSTVPRPWGMSSDQFQDEAKTRLMEAVKLRSNAKGDAEFFYSQNLNHFGLQNAGFGRYYVTLGNGFFLDREGKPVELDFTKPLDTPK